MSWAGAETLSKTDSLGRLGRMGFINALPVEWDLEQGRAAGKLELVSGPPTQLNRMLAAGELDVSAVSSISVLEHSRDWLALPGPCIASKGRVGSIFLVCERPLEELAEANGAVEVAFDPASATSVKLLQILFEKLWRIGFCPPRQNSKAPARLVIGDAALKAAQSWPPERLYDLGQAWRELTGKGFVFGLWAVRRRFAEQRPEAAAAIKAILEDSCRSAAARREEVVRAGAARLGLDEAVISEYYTRLKHRLDEDLRQGLELFGRMAGLDTSGLNWFETQRSG